MQSNRNPIQVFGLIMNKQTLDMNLVFDLVQKLNTFSGVCRDIIIILEDIFKHEKSSKILIAVNALQYFVKNCNINFHLAANRQSFQKRLLSLLNRLRGKTNLIKQLNSNMDNWSRIEAKVLYIVQLWYDSFILEESKYTNIINTYKILRKQNITFPPRSKNQKNLMLVQTQSPIFDNIQQIADEDQKKFCKKLNALGLNHLSTKLQKNIQNQVNKHQKKTIDFSKQINIDDISQKIAIIQSTEYSTQQTLKTIEYIKKATEYGKVKPNEQAYWRQIKQAAEKLVEEWQNKNAELIKNEEQKYLQRKLGMMSINKSEQMKKQKQTNQKSQIQQNFQVNLLDL